MIQTLYHNRKTGENPKSNEKFRYIVFIKISCSYKSEVELILKVLGVAPKFSKNPQQLYMILLETKLTS